MVEVNYNAISELPKEEELIRNVVDKVLTEEKVLCDVDVYIPSDWQVENNMQNSLSDVDIDHSKGTGTKLILQGRNTMGDLTVKHVKD